MEIKLLLRLSPAMLLRPSQAMVLSPSPHMDLSSQLTLPTRRGTISNLLMVKPQIKLMEAIIPKIMKEIIPNPEIILWDTARGITTNTWVEVGEGETTPPRIRAIGISHTRL